MARDELVPMTIRRVPGRGGLWRDEVLVLAGRPRIPTANGATDRQDRSSCGTRGETPLGDAEPSRPRRGRRDPPRRGRGGGPGARLPPPPAVVTPEPFGWAPGRHLWAPWGAFIAAATHRGLLALLRAAVLRHARSRTNGSISSVSSTTGRAPPPPRLGRRWSAGLVEGPRPHGLAGGGRRSD